MAKRTVAEIELAMADISHEDINEKKALVNFGLTNEAVAFVLASTEDDLDDDGWRTLLTEMYTGTKQSVVDAAWNLTGFDGTDEELALMQQFVDGFVAENDRAPNLSPNAIWAIITDADNQARCGTDAALWNEAFEEAEPDDTDTGDAQGTTDTARISDATQSAVKVADLLSENAEFIGTLNKTTESSAFVKIAPLLLMQTLEKSMGGDAMLGMPTAGSISVENGKETFRPVVGNTQYDIYKVPGKGKRIVRASFYGTVFKSLPPGLECLNELAKLEAGDAKSGPYSNAQSMDDKGVSAWTQSRREAWRKTVTQRINDGTKAIRNAFALYHQYSWLKSFKDVHISIISDGGSEPARVAQPFWIAPLNADGTVNYGQGESYSIGQVLTFDRDKTEVAGNNYAALIKSAARVQSETEKAAKLKAAQELIAAAIKAGKITPMGEIKPTAQATEVGLILNINQAESYIGAMAHFARDLAEAEPDFPLSKDFAKAIGTNDALALSLRDVIRLMDSIRARVEVQCRKIEAKEIQAAGNGTPQAKVG